eukprot:COSAG01_NODE_3308_length_6284_cov_32.195473_6_plen_68_part_00
MHTEQVTSIVGSRVHRFAGPAYATSKAALGALTREIAAEFGQLGLRYHHQYAALWDAYHSARSLDCD